MIRLKSSEDIAILRECGRRHAAVLRKLAGLVVPGVSTKALNTAAEDEIKKLGDTAAFLRYTPEGAKRPYPASLCVSINDEIVHGIPNESPKILKDGDIVSLDLGLVHKGMITDMAVTVPVGKIGKEDRELIVATRDALDAGIREAKPGNHIGDIGHAIETLAKERGFKIVEGLAGHGVGYEVHEDPFVPNSGTPGTGEELVPGMVIAIEPMLTTGSGKIKLDPDGYTFKTRDGAQSTHFEHTVLVSENGPVVLTRE